MRGFGLPGNIQGLEAEPPLGKPPLFWITLSTEMVNLEAQHPSQLLNLLSRIP
jgi:hypothetical protein